MTDLHILAYMKYWWENHSVKQGTLSVVVYIDKFEDIMVVVRDEHSYLQEHYYVVSFVNGLKPNIRCNLRSQKPKTLTQAYWMAKDYESGFETKYQACVEQQERQLQPYSCTKPVTTTISQCLFLQLLDTSPTYL